MNWRQVRALVWLRWRLLVNGWRRGGSLAAVPVVIVTAAAVLCAALSFLAGLLIGVGVFPRAEPLAILMAWDVVVAAFLFFWLIGLVTELQRTETLSLSKLLHLPIAIRSAFLINYASSLLRISTVLFVPAMLAMCLALVFTRGLGALFVFPAWLAFLLMVTALTYQFQGWLASLMTNPRRRRAIVVGLTAAFVLLFQLPNLVNMYGPWRTSAKSDATQALIREMEEIQRRYQTGEFDVHERLRLQNEAMERQQLDTDRATAESEAYWNRTLRLANTVLPIGWLPLGAMAAAEGNALPAVLACLAMTAIGAASLHRAYRTTIRIYQGGFTAGAGRAKPAAAEKATVVAEVAQRDLRERTSLVERRLPGFSEPVSVVALAGFRSFVRSPEAKMMLLTPLILSAVFGATILRGAHDPPPQFRPFFAFAAMGFVLMGMLQLTANQFGFDRDGFRVFVLSPVPRRDILLGKNLAVLPFALALAALLVAIVSAIYPLRWDHLLAMLPHFLSTYLLFCPVANLLSIYAPMHIAAGSMKASGAKLLPMLLQIAIMMCLLPSCLAPTLAPLGIELLFVQLGWIERAPVFLLLAVVEFAVVAVLYRYVLVWQGELLQRREQRIIDVVTKRAA